MVNIIPKGPQFHLTPIYETTSKTYWDSMILKGNHKYENLELKPAAQEKSIDKEFQNVWAISLKIYSICHIKYVGVVPLVLVKQFSINDKGGRSI